VTALYGIVTTTDICDIIAAAEQDPASITVADIMTSPIVCARPGWCLRQTAETMAEMRIHHLPVEDERRTLVGLISTTDIFLAVDESGWEAKL